MQKFTIAFVLFSSIGVCAPGQCNGSPINLIPNTGSTTFAGICRPLSITPYVNRWNCVGVVPDGSAPFPDRDIFMDTAVSSLGNGMCDFVVANGRLGAVASGPGRIERYGSNTGSSRTRIGNVTELPSNGTLDWLGDYSYGPNSVARPFEFYVSQSRDYTVHMSSSATSEVRWRLYAPGADASWRPRVDYISGAQGTSGTGVVGPFWLNVGWHAIVAFKNGEPFGSGQPYRIRVRATSLPAPAIFNVNPYSFNTGPNSPTLVNVVGADFHPSSVVTWDGTPLATTYVDSTRLTGMVPCSLLQTTGSADIRVSTPAPGGGTSGSRPVLVSSYAPRISTFDPPVGSVGALPGTLAIRGSRFLSGATVRIGGASASVLSTSYSEIVVSLSSLALTAGGVAVEVCNPGHCGASSVCDTEVWLTKDVIPSVETSIRNPATKHYYYSSVYPVSITRARQLANDMGGYLVAINSASEQAWLTATFGSLQLQWIGLRRNPSGSSTFTWDSGEPVNYTNWCPGEPSFAFEDFTVMNWGNNAGAASPSCWNDVSGNPATDRFVAIVEIEPEYQPNQAGATLVVDSVSPSPHSGVVITRAEGDPVSMSLFSLNIGNVWDVFVTSAPSIARREGALTTAGGQVINLDTTAADFSALFGSAAPLATGPFAPRTVTYVAATVGLSPSDSTGVSAQMLVFDVAQVDGFALSASADVRVVAAGTMIDVVPAVDDGSHMVSLPLGFSDIPFGDPSGNGPYSDLYVNSNGSISFSGGDANPVPSSSDFVGGRPKLAGLWTDLDPTAGGCVSVSLSDNGSDPSYIVRFDRIAAFGTNRRVSFGLILRPQQGTAEIRNYFADPMIRAASLVGISGSDDPGPIGGVSLSGMPATAFSQTIILGTQYGPPTDAIYEYRNPGNPPPSGFSSLFMPSSNGSEWIVN